MEAVLSGMTQALQHRGPDDAGLWCDPASGIALGHRRLSILDLSPLGHQPMFSADGRYVLAYNGEIYNFQTLRSELAALGHAFRGHSDTEVLLAAVSQWGFEDSLRRCNGMFAIALWDRQQQQLWLARDRLGEKPLYYGWAGDVLLFGSELKALRMHPEFRADIDRDALAQYLRYGNVPAPRSIYRGIGKLAPGHVARINGRHCQVWPYWSAVDAAQQGQRQPFVGDVQEALGQLDQLLRDSVKLRMAADVPLGAFLSGGIDSSMVVALMQAQSSRPVKTFTIGFHEAGYNEAEQAKQVAAQLGTEHTELYLSWQDALAVVPRLPTLYDEPFADSSQIPTFLVSELARRQVTVSLSGDGGDELFFGYKRYFQGLAFAQRWGRLPTPLRAALVACVPSQAQGRVARKLRQIAAGPDAFYRDISSLWPQPAALLVDGDEPAAAPLPADLDFASRMMLGDMCGYLADDILVKVDRASMGVSLEARVPLLDHRLVEFAWRLPLDLKLQQGQGKWLLKQLLYRYLPETLLARPKMGFGVPLATWLRGPLRDWGEALLSPSRLREDGYFRPQPVQDAWLAHQRGERDASYALWAILMFQAWLHKDKT